MKSTMTLLMAGTFVAGCTTTVNMYPVKGPISESRPLTIIAATADGILGNTGKLEFVSPDNAQCQGQWSSVAPQSVSTDSASLFTQYGAASGFASSVSNAPGVNKGQAFCVCSDGTTFEVEFVTGSGTANGYGIASDSGGNIYKVLF